MNTIGLLPKRSRPQRRRGVAGSNRRSGGKHHPRQVAPESYGTRSLKSQPWIVDIAGSSYLIEPCRPIAEDYTHTPIDGRALIPASPIIGGGFGRTPPIATIARSPIHSIPTATAGARQPLNAQVPEFVPRSSQTASPGHSEPPASPPWCPVMAPNAAPAGAAMPNRQPTYLEEEAGRQVFDHVVRLADLPVLPQPTASNSQPQPRRESGTSSSGTLYSSTAGFDIQPSSAGRDSDELLWDPVYAAPLLDDAGETERGILSMARFLNEQILMSEASRQRPMTRHVYGLGFEMWV